MDEQFPPANGEVPANRFNLANLAELQRRESPLALRRLLELQIRPIAGQFDTAHLQAVHRHIFQDVYDWAGQLRTVGISKPNAQFPPPDFLKPALDTLFRELGRENLLYSLRMPAWARRAAYYLGEINAIHPFREGNGRAQREFIRELAVAGGHLLVWRPIGPSRMIEASQRSFLRKDYSGLEEILLESLHS
jgi:cell filamentation protein